MSLHGRIHTAKTMAISRLTFLSSVLITSVTFSSAEVNKLSFDLP